MDWAAQLNYGGFTGWRLPITVQPDASCDTHIGGADYGHNCTASEMGHLFYHELGGIANVPPPIGLQRDWGLFRNIQVGAYWSRDEHPFGPEQNAWVFVFDASIGSNLIGRQDVCGKLGCFRAWAVYDGDIAAVPLPAAAWLLGSGLIVFIGLSKCKYRIIIDRMSA